MNSRQAKTLAAVFTTPVSRFDPLDRHREPARRGRVPVDRGRRVSGPFRKGGIVASFHRPHPDKHAKRYQIRDARAYLTKLGIRP